MPIVLAWQLGRTDAADAARKLRRAADYIVRKGPDSEQERWENQGGWSPGDDRRRDRRARVRRRHRAPQRRHRDAPRAGRRPPTAGQRSVQALDGDDERPVSPGPYYLRVTKDARAGPGDDATRSATAARASADQRRVVDPSFLELVRLGVKRHDDPVILNTLASSTSA